MLFEGVWPLIPVQQEACTPPQSTSRPHACPDTSSSVEEGEHGAWALAVLGDFLSGEGSVLSKQQTPH